MVPFTHEDQVNSAPVLILINVEVKKTEHSTQETLRILSKVSQKKGFNLVF